MPSSEELKIQNADSKSNQSHNQSRRGAIKERKQAMKAALQGVNSTKERRDIKKRLGGRGIFDVSTDTYVKEDERNQNSQNSTILDDGVDRLRGSATDPDEPTY